MSKEIKFDFVWDAGGEIKRQAFTIDEILKAKVKTPRYSKGAINIQAELIAKRQFTGLHDANGVDCIYEGDIIDENGLIVGNVYESPSLHGAGANHTIAGMGSEEWRGSESIAMGRGCKYAKQ